MKALSVKQPWASLIVEPDPNNIGFGIKPIENRTWPCPKQYIGQRVLIHASKIPINFKFDIKGQASVSEIQITSMLNHCEENSLYGVIIGSIEIVDCVINHPSIWAEKTEGVTDCNTNEFIPRRKPRPIYNWVLANPIKFPQPIPAKGKLSFWDYTDIIAEPEEKGGALFCHCQLPVKEENQVRGDSRFGYYCTYCGGKWYK